MRVQLFNQNIGAVPMPIRYHDFCSAAFQGSADGRVDVLGHDMPEALIFWSVRC